MKQIFKDVVFLNGKHIIQNVPHIQLNKPSGEKFSRTFETEKKVIMLYNLMKEKQLNKLFYSDFYTDYLPEEDPYKAGRPKKY